MKTYEAVKIARIALETCRWDVKNECWFKDDIRANWYLQTPYKITHFADDVDSPYAP